MNRPNYEEFPRVVYGPNGATARIMSEDERPDGYFNTRAEQEAEWSDESAKAQEAVEATERRERAKTFLAAEGVKHAPNASTQTLEKRISEVKEEKATMIETLEKHKVIVPPNSTHKDLVDLQAELEKFLNEQDAKAKAEAKAAEDAAKAQDSAAGE